jgi:hypothetical protein
MSVYHHGAGHQSYTQNAWTQVSQMEPRMISESASVLTRSLALAGSFPPS